jgi:signal transduction histidine kinase
VPEEEYYYLRIGDTGRGLSQQKLERLLENKDLLVSEKGTRRESGTGLGFTIVKDFVRLLDGEIQASSQEDTGTEFIIRLPLVSIISA